MKATHLKPGEKVLFIHGFGSCGTGTKAETLRNYFGTEHLITPDLPVSPEETLHILSIIIEQEQPVATVSSSLGSFYATWINKDKPIPSIVINPAVNAPDTLQPHIGKHEHYCTGKEFELSQSHIDKLRTLKRSRLHLQEKYLVLLQQGDEILDYKQAVDFYQGQKIIMESDGNHRFENLVQYMTIIDDFIQQQRYENE